MSESLQLVAMHRHATYPYPQVTQSHSRYPATSSAFSASANPNEDWTKISDLAERRRIQNRIAQRNYRTLLPHSRKPWDEALTVFSRQEVEEETRRPRAKGGIELGITGAAAR
jgi:hypothetical protein